MQDKIVAKVVIQIKEEKTRDSSEVIASSCCCKKDINNINDKIGHICSHQQKR